MALNLLEGYDLSKMHHNSAEYLHTLIEAVRLAFADTLWCAELWKRLSVLHATVWRTFLSTHSFTWRYLSPKARCRSRASERSCHRPLVERLRSRAAQAY